MRILHVVKRVDAAWGGMPAAALNMARGQREAGFDVAVATTGGARWPRGKDVVRTESHGVPLWAFPVDRPAPYNCSVSLYKWLRRELSGFDLVEIHGVWDFPSMASTRVAMATGTPYLLHPHGSLDIFDLRANHFAVKSILGPWTARAIVHGAARVMVTASLEEERLQAYGAKGRFEVRPLPYFVEDHQGNPEAFRADYGLGDEFLVLFLGRVDSKKGLQYVIEAFSLLSSRIPNMHLVVGGSDDSRYAGDMRNLAANKGLSRRVHFLGHLGPQAKSSALAAADTLVLVSDNENYGLVLIEAAWWGVPMIISDEVYIGRQLEAGGAALIAKRNPAAVAAALTRLLEDGTLRSRMGTNAKTLASGALSWTHCNAVQNELRVSLYAPSRERSAAPRAPSGRRGV